MAGERTLNITTPYAADDVLEGPRRAVIDIGSNSVRLVIYSGPQRTPVAMFNEKILCALGRRDPQTGRLQEESMQRTLDVLTRYQHILKTTPVETLHVFATAAIRAAPNGPDFVKHIAKTGLPIRILTGEEEARLAALGVIFGNPDIHDSLTPPACHLCGDMGGGSLELTQIVGTAQQALGEKMSVPIGALQLMTQFGSNYQAAEKFVTAQLNAFPWLTDGTVRKLYCVGGAWRAIAKFHIALRRYPVHILHGYTIRPDQVISVCELLETQSEQSLLRMPGVQRKRATTLPYAALVLRKVMQRTKACELVVSSSGLREGILYDTLAPEIQAQHPFTVLARAYGIKFSSDVSFGQVAQDLTQTLFADETPAFQRLREGICMLSDIATYLHTDARASLGAQMALSLPLLGVGHSARIAVASAVFYRYKGNKSLPSVLCGELMQDTHHIFAKRLGLALRFLADIAPKAKGTLENCQFELTSDKIILNAPYALQMMIQSETPQRRFQALADAFAREASLAFF